MKLSELQTALENGFVIRRFGWETSYPSLTKENNIILNTFDLEANDWFVSYNNIKKSDLIEKGNVLFETITKDNLNIDEELESELHSDYIEEGSNVITDTSCICPDCKRELGIFDFIDEVYERDLDIDIIRNMEAHVFYYTLIDPDNKDWAFEAIMNGYNEHFKLRDDLFLEAISQIYDEDTLRKLLEDTEEIMDAYDEEE